MLGNVCVVQIQLIMQCNLRIIQDICLSFFNIIYRSCRPDSPGVYLP